jgi:predicted helicase
MTLSLKVFRAAYPTAFHDRVLKEGPKELTKKDIFYYVYGILHAPTYREKYKENLKKELPRIPLCTDFESYSRLGKALAELHLNYESKDIWPNLIVTTPNEADPDPVEKMKWARKYDPTVKKKVNDHTCLIYNSSTVISNIPESANSYKVNGKSPLEWVMSRYQVLTNKKTGITNDPNQI